MEQDVKFKKKIFKGITAYLLLLGCTNASASCNFEPGHRMTVNNINLPSRLAVSKSTPIGTVVFRSSYPSGPKSTFNCKNTNYSFRGVVARGISKYSGDKYLLSIGDTGLSIRISENGEYTPISNFREKVEHLTNWGPTDFEIIKTGNVESSATIGAGEIAAIRIDSLDVVSFRLPKEASVISETCKTPDVNVKMGKSAIGEFSDNGSSSQAIPFSISLYDCPADFVSATYKLLATASSPASNANLGIIGLNNGSTAKGIGLQITDGSFTPVALDKAHPIPGYSNKGGNFTIPLNARYIKAGSDVSAGTANAELTFVIDYQ